MNEHYVRTGTYVLNDEILLVSDEYLNQLLPAREEIVFGAVGSFCAGSSAVWLLSGLLLDDAVYLTIGLSLAIPAIIGIVKSYRLRRVRLNFLKSAKAKLVTR